MATERLSMHKAREILRQKWELGRTHREIAASVGQSLGVVAGTLGRAKAAGLDRAGPSVCLEDAILVSSQVRISADRERADRRIVNSQIGPS